MVISASGWAMAIASGRVAGSTTCAWCEKLVGAVRFGKPWQPTIDATTRTMLTTEGEPFVIRA